jgi:uncharacterized protein YkwD
MPLGIKVAVPLLVALSAISCLIIPVSVGTTQADPSSPTPEQLAQQPIIEPEQPGPSPAARTVPAQLAPAAQPPAAVPDDVAKALAALYGAAVVFSPPSAAVESLPADADPFVAVALRQLNAYRLEAGLAPYRYDAGLSKLAMAHVGYAKASSEAKLSWHGHFERPGQPGYSADGNAAATSSGIAYGNTDMMDALETLMSGPYHRMQFLRSGEVRVGAGFGAWEGSGNSIALFVTRGPEEARPSGSALEPRFTVFPAPGAQSVGIKFDRETPDPRPGFQSLPESERGPTGYPITISLSRADVQEFRSAQVIVMDQSGAPVDCWVTDPARPSTAKAPDIYAPGVSADNAFARNFNAVFIMPKALLERGSSYTVQARLVIGSKPLDFSWRFTTAHRVVWKVSAEPSAPWESLGYAVLHATIGDTIQLAPGVYQAPDTLVLKGIRLAGAGADVTRLERPASARLPLLALAGASAIEGLAIDYPGEIAFLRSGTTLLLRGVALDGGDGRTVAVSLWTSGATQRILDEPGW